MTWGTRSDAGALLGKTARAITTQKEKLFADGMARSRGSGWEVQLDGLREWWMRNVEARSHSPVGGPAAERAQRREVEAVSRQLPPDDLREVGESRQLREHYEAELARLKAEQLAGALVPVAEMEALMFGHIRQARDALLSSPSRVVDQLCAVLGSLTADQRHEVLRLLEGEMVKTAQDLARLPVGAGDAR